MTTLIVNDIRNTSGTTVMSNGYPRQPGQVIEYITSQCDGSTISTINGNITVQNVTAAQDFSTTYLDVTGSVITYTPPSWATKVIYQYTSTFAWQTTAHSIQHMKFFIDANEVIFARHNRSAQYLESRHAFEWVIPIGGTANTNTGRQASWTTPKTLKMQARRYAASSNGGILNGTVYWDGAGSNQFSIPSITLIAIA